MGASLSGGKSKQKSIESGWNNQNTQNTLDPFMEQLRKLYGEAGQAAAGSAAPSLDPSVGQAGGYYSALQNLGLGAQKILSGDQAAIQGAMNPYLGQVMEQVGAQYDKARKQGTNLVNDQATQARAFGGSRHGVAQGVALGEIGAAEGATKAGLLKTGFDDVMTRAQQAANLGLLGAQGGFGVGQYTTDFAAQNSPAMHKFRTLQSLIGTLPYTQNQYLQGNYKNRGTQTGHQAGGRAGFGKMAGG